MAEGNQAFQCVSDRSSIKVLASEGSNSTIHEQIFIDKRFCGPAASGNGGYVCGMLGGFIHSAAEVTLKIPPPLGEFLDVDTTDGGRIILLKGDTIVAEARHAELELEVPQPPAFDDAVLYSKNYIGFARHPFPTCFVCGPRRDRGDGLRIFPGQVPGRQLVAAPWIPDASLADDGGFVRQEFIWSSLDCPGALRYFPLDYD